MLSQDVNQVDDLNRKQGKWVKTYPNGTIRYEGQFYNDKPYGIFKYFYDDAKPKAVTVFSNDGIVAHTKTYFETGQIMAEGKFINRLKDSTWLYYSDVDSSLVASEEYKKGVLNGKSISYYPKTLQPAQIVIYKNGVKEGDFKKFFSDGKLMTKGIYKNDTLEGEFILYYDNGKTELKGWYKAGMETGKWQYYDESGKSITKDEYKRGKAK